MRDRDLDVYAVVGEVADSFGVPRADVKIAIAENPCAAETVVRIVIRDGEDEVGVEQRISDREWFDHRLRNDRILLIAQLVRQGFEAIGERIRQDDEAADLDAITVTHRS